MFKRVRAVALSALLVLIPALNTGCQSEQKDNVLRVMTKSEPKIFDSVKSDDLYSGNVITNVGEGLYTYGKDGLPTLGVAASEPTQKGSTYTFTLRDDAKWSDGKPVTAHDFAYAWKRALDPNVKCTYAGLFECIKGAKEYHEGKGKDVEGIQVKNDKTLSVTFTNKPSYFRDLFAFSTFLPQRKDLVEKHGDKYGTEADTMVYNGAFVVKNWKRGEKVELARNENYRDARNIKLDGVEIVYVKDGASAINLYNTGQLHSIELEADKVESFKDDKDLKKNDEPVNSFILFNHKKFSNVNIRKAMSLVLDRESYAKNIKRDGSKPTVDLIPHNLGASQEGKKFRDLYPATSTKADVAEAKRLWAQGIKGIGDNQKLQNIELVCGDSPEVRQLAEWFQEQMRANFGITVKITAVTTKLWSDRGAKGDFDLYIMGWMPDYNHPDTYTSLFHGKNDLNFGKWNNPEYDKLINEAKVASDDKKRDELLRKAEKLLFEDAGVIAICERAKNVLVKPEVEGLALLNFAASMFFKYASLKTGN